MRRSAPVCDTYICRPCWTGAGDFVAVGQVFDLQLEPGCLTERPYIGLAVGDADVQAAVVLGDAEPLGFLGDHEVEYAGRAHRPDDGGSAARVLDGVLDLSRLW